MQVHQAIKSFESGQLPSSWQAVYPQLSQHPEQAKRFLHLTQRFLELYPSQADEEIFFFSAPGRSEISGNHTDHQQGRVICAAVDQDIIAAVTLRQDRKVCLRSEGYDKIDCVDLSDLPPKAGEQEHSAALIRGVAARFHELGYTLGGFNAYTCSNVPAGSGLSSSAAFELLLASIFNSLFNGNSLDALTLAKIGQYAENVYFGKPSGLLDQCGSALGGFVQIDFADPTTPVVTSLGAPLEAAGYHIVVTKTGGSHDDLTADYAAIPKEMKEVAQALGSDYLGHVSAEDFWSKLPDLKQLLPTRSLLRAIHFFEENERVLLAAEALRQQNIPAFLNAIRASGKSSIEKLQNIWSSQRPDQQLLGLAIALSDHLLGEDGASRVHGGGFAGTIQAFVPTSKLATYIGGMEAVFGQGSVIPLQVRSSGACQLL